MTFYKYSEKVKKVPRFKKEVDKIAITEQKKQIAEIKHEINRIFQVANRRIQNVRNANVTSTAVKSLSAEYGGNLPNKFTVFTNAGLDFTDYNQYMKALDNYAKALKFVNNPTSSAIGARRFVKSVANKYNVPFEVANSVMDAVTNPQIVNGAIVINNWDSDVVKKMSDSVLSEYDKDVSNMSKEDFAMLVSNAIYDLINPKEETIDIFDL